MASKKPTTTTQPVKKPRVPKLQQQVTDLVAQQPEVVKTKRIKKTKEEPVAQENVVSNIPKRKSTLEKGSQAALDWGAKMKTLKEAKKAERLAQTTPVVA
jgi:PBP1b-binding outer membrane lipoprotein LpoB